MKDFQAEGSDNKEVILGEKALGRCKVTPSGGGRVHQADDLTGADQVIPHLLVEASTSGRAETVIKSW